MRMVEKQNLSVDPHMCKTPITKDESKPTLEKNSVGPKMKPLNIPTKNNGNEQKK